MKAVFISLVLLAVTALGHRAEAQSVSRVTSVISGKLARAGSTNRQSYSDATLKSLCEQGYTLAIYVYKGGDDRTVSCSKGSIRYVSMLNWSSPASIVNKIASEAASGGKTMVHCWYGVHASNMVTAAALVKMCNYSGEKAAAKFKAGVPAGSLPESKIEKMASAIEEMRPDGTRVSGCP